METKFRKSFFQNASSALFFQILYLLMTFIVRTIFVKQLGNDYLSINGLFLNVVALLSFAELGIGNAIIFSLYEPIARHNTTKITSLMNLFKKSYSWIRLAILLLGVLFIPFVHLLIDDVYIKESFEIIFVLFLINTYVSYFYAYKKSLLIADQKNYVVLMLQQAVFLVQSIIQIAVLIFLKNFVLYLIIQIGSTLITNVLTSHYVDNHYPYLKETHTLLKTQEKEDIFSNIKNIFFYKIGAVILNGTDNILISTLIATKLVGLYSNYLMVISALNSVLMQVCNSISGTIGNYNVLNSDEENERTFISIFTVSFLVFGICTICLIELLNPFIIVWIGRDYLLEFSTVIIISFVFYITGINQIPSQYRTSFGIFKQAKLVPIIAAGINVLLSVVFGKIIGLNGIFLATIVAKLFTFNIVDPILIYSKGFKKRCLPFLWYKVRLFIILLIAMVLVHSINNNIQLDGIIGFIVQTAITFISSAILIVLLLSSQKEFRQSYRSFKNGKS